MLRGMIQQDMHVPDVAAIAAALILVGITAFGLNPQDPEALADQASAEANTATTASLESPAKQPRRALWLDLLLPGRG